MREPRLLTIVAYDDANADRQIKAMAPPVTDADLVVVVRTFSKPDAA
jgi:hypothetical protein